MAERKKDGTRELDLDAEGLVGASYDSFFLIDKRIRKVQDLYIPTRRGISVNQVLIFFVALVFSFLFQVLIFGQLLNIFGIREHWMVFLLVVFGPPLLCAWRVTKPMPSAKSIPGTVTSLFIYFTDDVVHRRGIPIKTPKQPSDEFVQHYQRDWTVSQEFAAEIPGEGDWTDPETERLFERGQGHVDLQAWMDHKAIDHHLAERASKSTRTTTEITVHNRRGSGASVEEF